MELRERFAARDATIGVVGLGYVGLPLAMAFAEGGFRVCGIEVDSWKCDELNASRSYIPDVPAATVARMVACGRFQATTAYPQLCGCDAIIICVPTPLQQTRDPDTSYILAALEEIAPCLHDGQLVVLESTTYPGMTEEVLRPRLEHTGWRVGEDFFLAFSPERIDPGNATFNVYNTPKIVGGVTLACTEVAYALYATIVERVIPVSSTTAAEMVKLVENTFRAVNIGLVNEMALIANKLNLDIWEIIAAAASKPFGYMPFYPGPGLGGHCIPIDPLYLSWKLRALNYRARFIELADEVNSHMPVHVIDRVAFALNEDGRPIRGSRLLVLGVAYKRDITDWRESPAVSVIEGLLARGGLVDYQDDLVPTIVVGGHGAVPHRMLTSTPLDYAKLNAYDCVVLVTDHSYFDSVQLLNGARRIVDTRNFIGSRGRYLNGSSVDSLKVVGL